MTEEGTKIPIMYSDIPCHNLFACDPPNFLYHYTNYEGAKGIIESKSLWLTKLAYLNDKSELKITIDLFRNASHFWLDRIQEQEKKEFLEKVSDQLKSMEKINICVASFCENGDLLSQWRSYGNQGNGVALEFDAKALKSILNTGHMDLWKCIYSSRQDQMNIVNGLIEILLNSYDLISNGRSSSKNCAYDKKLWEYNKNNLISYFNTTFLRVAPAIKNYHFSEEQEWRIITRPIPFTDINWSCRISNNKVSQYYCLGFDLQKDNRTSDNILEGIIIGPTQEPWLVSEVFDVLACKNGYKIKHIAHSLIPYKHA